MDRNMTLDDITGGEISIDDVRAVVADAIENFDEDTASDLYYALRSWTWKALDNRRRDAELRGWHDLLKRIESYLSEIDSRISAQIAVLHELLFESIGVAETLRPEKVLERSHAERMVQLLLKQPGGIIARSQLIQVLGVKQANLSRVLRMMFASGLAERVATGKSISIRLTLLGRRHAALRASAHAASSIGALETLPEHVLRWRYQKESMKGPRSAASNITIYVSMDEAIRGRETPQMYGKVNSMSVQRLESGPTRPSMMKAGKNKRPMVPAYSTMEAEAA